MDIEDLRREIRELRERLDEFPSAPSKEEELLPEVVIQKDPACNGTKLKPTKFPTYNGDRLTYPAWRRAILSALKMDWNTFGYTNSRVFLMIYKALDGKAQKKAAAYFESGGTGGKEAPEDFISFLDRGNWDQTRVSRARSELNDLRMGQKQNWNSFYSLWANKLTEAKGDIWPDDVKISLLRGTINKSLRMALATNHLIPESDFSEFVRVVSKIALQQEEITKATCERPNLEFKSLISNKSSQETSVGKEANFEREWSRSGGEYGYAGNSDNSGDIIMGGVNSANVIRGANGKPMRAKWKSSEQIEKLRKERKCYRCERKGCSTRICGLLPAIKPNKRDLGVNISVLGPIDPRVCEENIGEEDVNIEIVSEN